MLGIVNIMLLLFEDEGKRRSLMNEASSWHLAPVQKFEPF